jgi:hypothetical protein
MLLCAALSAGAAPYAPRESDFGAVAGERDEAVCGVVEEVTEKDAASEPIAQALEHPVRADEQLRVRLGDGSVVVVVWDGAQRFQPGARVRLLHGRISPS